MEQAPLISPEEPQSNWLAVCQVLGVELDLRRNTELEVYEFFHADTIMVAFLTPRLCLIPLFFASEVKPSEIRSK